MPDNRNEVLELGKTAFSLLSFKIKMIIIGVVAILLIVVIFPVVALTTFSSENNKNIKINFLCAQNSKKLKIN